MSLTTEEAKAIGDLIQAHSELNTAYVEHLLAGKILQKDPGQAKEYYDERSAEMQRAERAFRDLFPTF